MDFRFSRHVEEELRRRCIPREALEAVLDHPQRVTEEREGQKVYQSRVEFQDGKVHLLRVIVSVETEPPVVVTAYRTSKIAKYWRGQ